MQIFFKYIVDKHGKTLLPQFLGLYRVTVLGAELYLMVMRNIFGRKYQIHKKFDLKVRKFEKSAEDIKDFR